MNFYSTQTKRLGFDSQGN